MQHSLISNEFALVAACCRWPPDRERTRAIREAAAAELDWARFVRIVNRQRVAPLVSDGIRREGIGAPPEVVAALHSAASSIAARNLLFTAESARLSELLELAAIPALFLKGVPLAILAYGSLSLKMSYDIDLLVGPELILDACDVLSGAGYRRIRPDASLGPDQFRTWLSISKDSAWLHPEKNIIVELHSRLIDNQLLLAQLPSGSQEVEVSPGIILPTLKPDELFIYLCVHGASHGWSRLKWLADVGALIGNRDEAEISSLYRSSVEAGAGRSSAQALLLCTQLLGTKIPLALEAELRGSRINEWLVATALRTMAGKWESTELDEGVTATARIHLSHFALAPGWRYKLSEAQRKATNREQRTTIRLPRSLVFLYPFLLLPVWLARRARQAEKSVS